MKNKLEFMNQKSLPIFPLNYLILPGEKKFLHIFEERYKELLKDCLNSGSDFGIVTWLKNKPHSARILSDIGVAVKIVRILKTTEKGETDLIVEGEGIFKLSNFRSVASPKLYGMADADFFRNEHLTRNEELITSCNTLLKTLKKKSIHLKKDEISVYSLAESLNLTAEEKVKLLKGETMEAKENLLLNKVRLENQILKAEVELDGDFWLN